MSIEIEAIIAALSLLLSVSLAIFYFRDRRNARFSIENDYTNELLEWHKDVVDVLVRIRCLEDSESKKDRNIDLCLLSSLIEQGRFFFPNIDRKDSYGVDKPPAYRGYRNLGLDFLVASYNLARQSSDQEKYNQLWLLQQHFTSIVFDIVRPRERLSRIRALTDRYFVKEESFENFLSNPDEKILDHIWIQRNEF